MTAGELRAHLTGARGAQDKYVAACPAHEDRQASLSVATGDDGRVLINCFAGCSAEAIVGALGLRMADLFPAREPSPGGPSRPAPARTTRYAIRDPAGALVAVHVREDRPGQRKQIRWERPDGTPDLGGRKVETLPLYGVDALPADTTVPVVLVEGEKARDALHARRIPAVGTVTGAGTTPSDAVLRALLGRPVRLWPDADAPGRAHMQRIATALRRLGHTDVRIVDWPEAPEKGDAHDFLDQGGTLEALTALLGAAALVGAEEGTGQPGAAAGTTTRGPWAAALDAPSFLAAEEIEFDFLEARLLAPGSVTQMYSPRGLGKTHYAMHLAVKLARAGKRVLYVDRDNSRREVRRRLRAWGAAEVPSLKVLTRDSAPPLTDAAAWALFPFTDYDLIIIDSIDSATEGVGEQSSEKPSKAIAPLLDIAHREDGPAILLLGNVIKSGSHSRGSGVVEDRADIVYEVRDATDLRPSGSKPWIEELPPADAGSWVARASRRQRRDVYRLAFVPTKFRIGEEPEPFIIEIDLRTEPWTARDATDEVDQAGVQARAQRDADRQAMEAKAEAALLEEIRLRAGAGDPLHARAEAEPFLVNMGMKRQAARDLLRARAGALWRIEERPGAHGARAKVLLPVEDPVVSPDDGHKADGHERRAQSGDSDAVCGRPLQMLTATYGARNAAPDAAIRRVPFAADPQTDGRPPSGDPHAPEPGSFDGPPLVEAEAVDEATAALRGRL